MTLSSISMRLAPPGTALMVNWRSCLLKMPFSAYESHICYGGRHIYLGNPSENGGFSVDHLGDRTRR
jgi:hypothetical protein